MAVPSLNFSGSTQDGFGVNLTMAWSVEGYNFDSPQADALIEKIVQAMIEVWPGFHDISVRGSEEISTNRTPQL